MQASVGAKLAQNGRGRFGSYDDPENYLPDQQAAARKGRYNLEELMKERDPEVPLSEEERAWLDAPPMDREAL